MALMLCGALGACSVGPDYEKPPLAVPAKWSNNAGATTAKPAEFGQWWKRLNDPTLNNIVEQAASGNLDVASAKARIREARATYDQAVGGLFPSVSGTSSATRSKSGGAGSSGSVSNTLRAGLDASWEVDLFGANRRTVEAARYGLDAAEEDLRATLVTLVGDIATNYIDVRSYQARLALARRTAATQSETAALTRAQFNAGAASGVDLANATGQVATTEAGIPTLEASLAQSMHRLGVLTGQAPTALSALLRKGGAVPAPRLPLPVGVPADVLLSRPDVRLAERQLAQATARIGAAEADRYPAISLTGSVSTSGVRLGDLAKNSSISWSFGPSLSVPVFNAGQLQAAVEAAQAQRDQQFLNLRATVLTALEEVENAVVALAQERVRHEKLAQSVASYRESARLARTLFESGSTSFIEVLDAERSLYSAEDSLIQSRVNITTQYIALNKALGGGWNGAVNAGKPEIVDRMGPRPAAFLRGDGKN
ncbi:efflux transporter outer membrane subunit [Pseudochelatococcus lubricantis]|uniref:efflux transporter outer membrane subunit n=1 Tax=Pseudochelatococcus lubricantis TaxID=1538102 RepID=UPI0035E8B124